jgi:transcriptional regulator with XRE-family HTH domain
VAAEVIRLETRRRGAWRVAVGRVLREWRTDQGLRLADVAAAAGVSTQYLSEVERGRKEPSSEVLGAVTEALGSSLSELALGVAKGLRDAPARPRSAQPAAAPTRTAVLPSPTRSSGEVTLLAA